MHKKRSANGVNIYGLLAKLLQSGWLDIGQVPFFFFLRVYGPLRSSAILTERGWSIKDLLYGQRTLFFAGHSFILPGHGASHIHVINISYWPSARAVLGEYRPEDTKNTKGRYSLSTVLSKLGRR